MSCDAGKRREQPTLGPAVLILGVSVGDDRPMPADGAIQISFDRYLLPTSVLRQAVVILDGANKPVSPGLAPVVQYDPIARTVTVTPPRPLTEGQPYKLILPIPEGDSDVGGLRAIDRATLYPEQKREFAFFAGPKTGPRVEPQSSFCRDVLPIFVAKCSVATCHGSGDGVAAAGLALDTSTAVAATALNRVAQGSNRGSRASETTTSERHFGIDMPIIDPGSPANSWLLYKIELAAPPVAPFPPPGYACTNGLLERGEKFSYTPLAPNVQRSADNLERSILSDYVLGREMPYPVVTASAWEDQPLTFDERQKIRLWIQSLTKGASVPECGGCAIAPETDGGAREGGVDSGSDAGVRDATADDAADAAQ